MKKIITSQKNFNEKYFYNGVYKNFDTFLDYGRIARGLVRHYNFESFLDVGCGCGNLVKEIKKVLEKKLGRNCDVYGIDFSQFAVRRANSPFILRADCTKMFPFREKQFDLVYVYASFSYIKDPGGIKKAIKNVYKAAKKIILFEDVYSQKEANNPINCDPYRLRVFAKKQWAELWKEVLKKGDQLFIRKKDIIIFKK